MTCIKIKEYVRVSIGAGHHMKNLQHFVAGFLLYTKDFLSDW